MHNLAGKLRTNIPYYLQGIMEFYPDVILYNFKQFEFSEHWQQLFNSKFLYAEGSEIKTTNWFMYSLQTLKGWFGFENFCHPKRITYCLDKLVYYGYTQGYFLDGIKNLKSYPLSFNTTSLAIHHYNDKTTEQFQNELITSYLTSKQYLPAEIFNHTGNSKPRFGQSWLDIGALELVPLLDPQDSELISEVILKLDSLGISKVDYIPNSKFALHAAEFYLEQVNKLSEKSGNMPKQNFIYNLFSGWQEILSNVLQWNSKTFQESDPRLPLLERALYFNSTLAEKYPIIFIEFYLGKKQYKEVLHLVTLLEDSKLILGYLLLIPEAIRNSLIVKDSKLAAILSQHYLINNQFAFAQAIFTNIEEINPGKAFTIAVQNKNYIDAYKLFMRFKDEVIFMDTDRKALAKAYIDKAEEQYKLGRQYRDKKEWTESVQFYYNSYLQKKAAYSLDPSEENAKELLSHKRLYAQVLVDSDIDLHEPESSDISSIQKAINLLKECESNDKDEQRYHKLALANALMRRVDTLKEKVALPANMPSDYKSLIQYRQTHESELSILIKTLKELVDLLKDNKESSLKKYLGKTYFLLADTAEFFSIADSHIKQNYRRAVETVPENPFYNLRASEVFESEKDKFIDLAYSNMSRLGLSAFDYLHWFDERWIKRDETNYKIKDIHELATSDTSESKWRLSW